MMTIMRTVKAKRTKMRKINLQQRVAVMLNDQEFLDVWLDKKLAANIIEPCFGNENNTTMPTSPLVLIKKPAPSTDPYRVTLDDMYAFQRTT